jgi:hypothetical protein
MYDVLIHFKNGKKKRTKVNTDFNTILKSIPVYEGWTIIGKVICNSKDILMIEVKK